jgi:hypothetical protein
MVSEIFSVPGIISEDRHLPCFTEILAKTPTSDFDWLDWASWEAA